MMRWRNILLALCLLVLLAPTLPLTAQDGGTACLEIVTTALETIDAACGGLGVNDACYGYNRVDVTFWEPRDDLTFSAPADTVPLNTLQNVATAPLDTDTGLWGVAVLQLQANLPGTLPGQAVMMLLMGDTTVENKVPPEEAAEPVTPVAVTTTVAANLRSRPTTASNVVGSVPGDTVLQAVGVNDAGDWLEVVPENIGRAWIAATLVMADETDALAALPVTYGEGIPPRYGPVQAFHFTTGLGGLNCQEAPDALVLRNPTGIEITFNVNGLDVTLGSTVVFTVVQIMTADGPVNVLIVSLVEGDVTFNFNGVTIHLTQTGQSFAVTLNEDGNVDENSELVDPPDDAQGGTIVENACQNAALLANLFPGLGVEDCTGELQFYTPPPPGDDGPGDGTNGGENGGSDGGTDGGPPSETCNWPMITYPPSGTNVTGSGTHDVFFTPVEGASSYVWHIQGDGHDYAASGSTTTTSFLFDVGALPTGAGGRGYFISVTPYGADGNPLCEGQNPNAIWISKDLGAPPPTTLPPLPVCGNSVVEEGEECDPPDDETCDAVCQTIVPPLPATEEPAPPATEEPGPICGNYIVEPGEDCDPPDGLYCDATCHSIGF